MAAYLTHTHTHVHKQTRTHTHTCKHMPTHRKQEAVNMQQVTPANDGTVNMHAASVALSVCVCMFVCVCVTAQAVGGQESSVH